MTARVSIKRHNRGYVGTITVRSDAHPDVGVAGVGAIDDDIIIQVGAVGDSGADALLKAGAVVDRIMSDPVMQAILPPQAVVAVKTAKQLASAAKKGGKALRSLWGKIRGKGKKRLAKALAKSSPRSGVRDKRSTAARTPFRPSRGAPPPMRSARATQREVAPMEPEYDEEYDEDMEQYDLGPESDPDAVYPEPDEGGEIVDDSQPGPVDDEGMPEGDNSVDDEGDPQ